MEKPRAAHLHTPTGSSKCERTQPSVIKSRDGTVIAHGSGHRRNLLIFTPLLDAVRDISREREANQSYYVSFNAHPHSAHAKTFLFPGSMEQFIQM